MKKSLSALALQGLLGAASWGFGDEIRMALLCCLFPVNFEVCRHQFQEETRGVIFTGDVCRIGLAWMEFLEEVSLSILTF